MHAMMKTCWLHPDDHQKYSLKIGNHHFGQIPLLFRSSSKIQKEKYLKQRMIKVSGKVTKSTTKHKDLRLISKKEIPICFNTSISAYSGLLWIWVYTRTTRDKNVNRKVVHFRMANFASYITIPTLEQKISLCKFIPMLYSMKTFLYPSL